jgi:hypothetical protein
MGLRYQSQFEGKRWRLEGRASKLRTRLGGSPSLGDPFPAKPKYMRWAKYQRLANRYYELVDRIAAHWTAQAAAMEAALANRRSGRRQRR